MRRCELSHMDVVRFLSHVDLSGDCWEWQRATDRDGYGLFKLNKRMRFAHRVAYVIENGDLDPNLLVCHSCDNPPCVNPQHLWTGSNKDNQRDKSVKGRIGGERNPNAKVTETDMAQILERHSLGESVKSLTDEYGFSRCHLYKVLRGDQWKSIAR